MKIFNFYYTINSLLKDEIFEKAVKTCFCSIFFFLISGKKAQDP